MVCFGGISFRKALTSQKFELDCEEEHDFPLSNVT